MEKLRPPACFEELAWLVGTHGNSKHKQVQSFYSPNHNGKAYIKSIPELRGKKIVMSRHGWLLLQDRSQASNLSFFNPVTSQTISLPPLQVPLDEDEPCSRLCALTLPPDGDECMLLVCLNGAGLLASCHPAQPDCSWVTQPLEQLYAHITDVASLNGVIHGITSSCLLFCVEEDDSKSHILKPLQTITFDVDFYSDGLVSYLLESCDRLYSVVLYFFIEEDPQLQPLAQINAVKVWELDLQHNNSCSWVELKSLDGRTFFLSSNTNVAWCWSTDTKRRLDDSIGSGIASSCIYIYEPELSETLILYNLLDQTCTSLPPCPSLLTPCDHPFWVIPQQQQQSRLSASEEQKENIMKIGFLDQKVSPIECQELSQAQEEDDILNKLPFHLIELVANRMHLFEYLSFRVCCKILISSLPKKPLQNTINNRPLFMVFNKSDGLCTIMDPCRHDSRSKSVFVSLLDTLTLECSKSGWVLYLVGKKSLEYVNVVTGVKGGFPPLPLENSEIHYKSIAFSTYPACSECLTIAIYGNNEQVAFSYLRFGDKEWKFSWFELEFPFHLTRSTPVFLKGAFYYMDASGYLGELRLMDQPTWRVYPDKPQIQVDSLYLSSLVECNEQLYSIFVGKMGNWIQVFWFDDLKKCWVEIHHLENFTLFIGRKSSISMVTSDDQMRNKIFLPSLRDKTIVYYSLSTKKYHIWGYDDVMDNLLGLKEPQWSCWF